MRSDTGSLLYFATGVVVFKLTCRIMTVLERNRSLLFNCFKILGSTAITVRRTGNHEAKSHAHRYQRKQQRVSDL